jgi:ribonuclease HI
MSNTEQTVNAVIYTDGGCRPSRGIGGWAIHGYVYTTEKAKQGTGAPALVSNFGYIKPEDGNDGMYFRDYRSADRDAEVERYTEDRIVGVQPLRYVSGYGSLIPESTNNEAEVTALLEALTVAIEQKVSSVMLVVDSKYALNGLLNWGHKWQRNNWVKPDTSPVANAALWQKVLAAEEILVGRGTVINTRWVRGHSGDVGNDIVDSFASAAIVAGRKQLKVREVEYAEAKGYWSVKADYNRMISHPYWYFNTNVGGTQVAPDGRVVYYLGDHGSESDFCGKKISDASFSVLFLKERNPVMEMLTQYQDTLDTGGFNSMVVGSMNNILGGKTYTDLEKYGNQFLQCNNYGKMDLFTHGDLLLTKDLKPPRIAFRVMQAMGVMESMLNDFISDKAICVPIGHTFIQKDITSLLYEVNTTKKKPVTKLLPSISSMTKRLEIEADYHTGVKSGQFKLPITLGIDIANRNTLSALAPLNPKVSLITWRESDTAFRYATIIKTDDDIGIWAGIYSNICLLTS